MRVQCDCSGAQVVLFWLLACCLSLLLQFGRHHAGLRNYRVLLDPELVCHEWQCLPKCNLRGIAVLFAVGGYKGGASAHAASHQSVTMSQHVAQIVKKDCPANFHVLPLA